MNTKIYDFVVIGSGPAGFSAAIQAAKAQKKVLVIEQAYDVGGACINTGTFPSKTLRETVLQLTNYLLKNVDGIIELPKTTVSMDHLRARLNDVTSKEHCIIRKMLERNGVELVFGHGKIISQNFVEIIPSEGSVFSVKTDFIIIATGSTPRNPNDIEFDHHRILDSSTLLGIDEIPKSLMIIGGGVIATEYATIFAALGTKITIVDKSPCLLKFLDSDMNKYLMEYFPKGNVTYLPNIDNFTISKTQDCVVTTLDNGKQFVTEKLLYALGRMANSEGLGLDTVGIELNDYRYIQVNDHYQTRVKNIYAVGDIIGWPSLAATSIAQGRHAVRHALQYKNLSFPTLFPVGIYTIPEISYVGKTEEEVMAEGMDYVVGFSKYDELPRAQISGYTEGYVKMIVHAQTMEILGVHAIGMGATEIIHAAQVALNYNAKATLFTESIFNYPTFSESLRIAALSAVNLIYQNGSKRTKR